MKGRMVAGIVVGIAAVGAGIWWRAQRPHPAAPTAPTPIAMGDLPHPVQVEVLNASRVQGMARIGAIRLRAGGLDVVYFGTAGGVSTAAATTRVLMRSSDTTGLGRILAIVGEVPVETAPPENRWVAFSVLLGKDFADRYTDRKDSLP